MSKCFGEVVAISDLDIKVQGEESTEDTSRLMLDVGEAVPMVSWKPFD